MATALMIVAGCVEGAGSSAADDDRQPGPASPEMSDGTAASSPAGIGTATAGIGTRQLVHPDDLQLVLLGYRLRGVPPPIDDWAAGQHDVIRANEFERADALERERERLRGIDDSTAGIGNLRFNVSARLGEYDGTRGGYYLDAFTPGSHFDFSPVVAAQPRTVERIRLQVQNGEELNFWPLGPDAARQVLQANGNARGVTLDSQFRITGIAQGVDGPTIALQLQRYRIVSQRHGQPAVLGEQVFHE